MKGERSYMTLKELLDDIHSLNHELEKYERKFGVTSEDFYQLYQQGKLDEGEFEEIQEFCEWAGIYQIKVKQERKFRKLSQSFIHELQRTMPDSFRLEPRDELTEVP
jgi:hypothetical protein